MRIAPEFEPWSQRVDLYQLTTEKGWPGFAIKHQSSVQERSIIEMSFFGRGSGSANPPASQGNFDAAATELEMVSDLFNRLVRSCHTKCIGNRYSEADLNKGESICIDRCVDKFFKVNTKVGERIQAKGASAQAQALPS
ncbi:hypothetical protein O181_015105 [Austropuccinia psidii MF-1]|uniref:Mitochondrial import inner membrane translocase subunit n=1 Tax=Austropuccinia psidii MF-1 TaxID=1389203 RepID=A0A9Q3GQK9_9BASI|nr:hypothetical protein [Austropuccinia psidii MF-1]